MKVVLSPYGRSEILDLSGLIRHQLSPDEFSGNGELENLREHVDNLSSLLESLLVRLVESGKMTFDELCEDLPGYVDAEIIK